MKPLYLDTTQTKGGAIPVHWKKIIAPVIITTLPDEMLKRKPGTMNVFIFKNQVGYQGT